MLVDAMAKLKTDPITQADLAEFSRNDSDFALELRVLLQLRGLGFQCEHSAYYEDPVDHKFRQFDIRADKNFGKVLIALAVECKNLGAHKPLLLSTVPRTQAESFHESIEFLRGSIGINSSTCRRAEGVASVYRVGESVGKKSDQVARNDQNRLIRDDGEAYDKLSQAVHSSRDLVRRCGLTSQEPHSRVILPVLVVPDDVLWQVDYTADGLMCQEPRTVSAATFFLGRSWEFDAGYGLGIYNMSHLEIWTL